MYYECLISGSWKIEEPSLGADLLPGKAIKEGPQSCHDIG
jgi:hypothetical protein